MNRKWFLPGLALALLAIIALAYLALNQRTALNGSSIQPPVNMGDFTLQSDAGPVTLSQFRGKHVILFFGFTHCKDICPVTMALLKKSLSQLGPDAEKFQVIFVSVDPARDTPQISSEYARLFNPAFLGLTGSTAEIETVTKQYGISYELLPPDANGDYEVEHTASVLVLNTQGELMLTWPFGLQAEQMEQDMKAIVNQ
ncbi:MAG: SCO family protein [Anaerolineales bacterium]